uniref:Uncharacterized protein n=1 Tax=Cacopsylla melanoneura TaxID=428564 RepID=A0A8D8ZAJ0_9HEMI
MPSKLTSIFLVAGIIHLIGAERTPLCHLEKCSDPVEISVPSPPQINITSEERLAQLKKINHELEVTYHQTQCYTAVCSFGILHQDSRGCSKITSNIVQGISEMRHISKGEGSLAGKFCHDPDDCSVDDCMNKMLIHRKQGNKDFTYQGES